MSGILVGVDGSDRSRHALEWAVDEAAARNAPLTVLTVCQAYPGIWGAPGDYLKDQDHRMQAEEAVRSETDLVLQKVGDDAQPASVAVRAVIGLPAEELLRAAAAADLVVVGARGVGGFQRLPMGSVSTTVSLHAPCPVVVVPSDERLAG